MKILNDQKGIALIIVILIIGVLVILSLQLNRSSRVAIYEAANLSDSIQLEYVAKSGFNIAGTLLLSETGEDATLVSEWADKERLSLRFQDLFENADCRVSIEDESGKIPLNCLTSGIGGNSEIRSVLVRFLCFPELGMNEEQASKIVDSLVECMGAHGEAISGGESVDCIEKSSRTIKDAQESFPNGMDPKPDLCKYITFHGEGRININTAPLFVLRALSPDVTEEMALKMDTFRRNRGNDLSDATWYKQIIGMSNVTINPQLTTTKSDTFMIVSTGVSGPMNKSIVAVVRRNPDKKSIKLLSWKVE